MASINDLPTATAPGQFYTVTDGRQYISAYDRDPNDPDAQFIWNEVVQQVGRDQLDFVDGAIETTDRVLVLTADNQLSTIAQSTQTGSGITEGEALDLIDASVASPLAGLVSTGTGTIGIELVNRIPRGVAIASPLVTNQTVTNPTMGRSYLVYDISPLFGQIRGSLFILRELTAASENFILGLDASVAPYLVHNY